MKDIREQTGKRNVTSIIREIELLFCLILTRILSLQDAVPANICFAYSSHLVVTVTIIYHV